MYTIIVDSAANIPATLVDQYNIMVLPMQVFVDNKEIPGFIPHLSLEEERAKGKEYYDAVRNGAKVKTSLVSTGRFEEVFEEELKKGNDVIYISLSSNISGTYQAACIAASDLEDTYKDHKVYCVDSMNASLAQGNLAIYASQMLSQGVEAKEAARILQECAHGMNGVFTVDDLKYLAATGRLHGGVAVVGQMLKIKPLLKGNKDGFIVSFQKCHGRKKALNALIDIVCENAIHPEKQILGIAQADCYEESCYVVDKILERVQFKEVINTSYDYCTGSHVGPGTIALFFIGSDRELAGKNETDYEIFKYL